MTSRRALTVCAIVIWAGVAVTAAPRAVSHRHLAAISLAEDTASPSCSDFHFRFDEHEAVVQSEERIITKAEAPTLRIEANSNGGLFVEGWDQNSYSVTLCKAAEAGPDAQSVLSKMHISFRDGVVRIDNPASGKHFAAHLLVRAPRASSLDLHVQNGPMTLKHVDGKLQVHAENGPVTVSRCTGELDLSSHNGPVTLEANSGKQNVQSENGPMTLSLSGHSWDGSGLDARTTNGPVTLAVPSGYQSGVLLESDGNSPFLCRASVCSEGRKTWDEDHKRLEFGSGPALVRVSTVNGPVSVR